VWVEMPSSFKKMSRRARNTVGKSFTKKSQKLSRNMFFENYERPKYYGGVKYNQAVEAERNVI